MVTSKLNFRLWLIWNLFNCVFTDHLMSTIYFDHFHWNLRIAVPELETLKSWKPYKIKSVAIVIWDRIVFENTLHFSCSRMAIVVQNIWICLGKTFNWASIKRYLKLDLKILKTKPETPKVWKRYKINNVRCNRHQGTERIWKYPTF